MKMFSEHKERQEGFSFRKLWAFAGVLVFVVSAIGNQVYNGFKELPKSYIGIIILIVTFYFGKTLVSGKKLVVKDETVK